MKEVFFVIEKDEEGWYVGSVPSLPGCHTQARTLDELHERMKEAIQLYLETVPDAAPGSTTFIAVQQVAV